MLIQISWLLKKPTDLDLHCLSLNMCITIKNLDQVIWLAGNYKWAWHLNLFSMTRVKDLDNADPHHIWTKQTYRYIPRPIFLRTCLVINPRHSPDSQHICYISEKWLLACAKRADSDHPAHAQSIIQAFALCSYILWYPIILLVYSEGLDQTAQMHRLIRAFTVHICPKTCSHGMAHLFFNP